MEVLSDQHLMNAGDLESFARGDHFDAYAFMQDDDGFKWFNDGHVRKAHQYLAEEMKKGVGNARGTAAGFSLSHYCSVLEAMYYVWRPGPGSNRQAGVYLGCRVCEKTLFWHNTIIQARSAWLCRGPSPALRGTTHPRSKNRDSRKSKSLGRGTLRGERRRSTVRRASRVHAGGVAVVLRAPLTGVREAAGRLAWCRSTRAGRVRPTSPATSTRC